MARDRFGFLQRHGFVKSSSGSTQIWRNRLLVALSPVWDLLSKDLFVAAMNTFETKLRRAGGALTGFPSSPCPGAALLLRAKDLLIAATAMFLTYWPRKHCSRIYSHLAA
jgi:hypothetical protein